jgi:hypothetical protein
MTVILSPGVSVGRTVKYDFRQGFQEISALAPRLQIVMAGLVPAIHASLLARKA